MPPSKIKVLFHSNHSRLFTGFGKNIKNVLLALHDDPEIEVIEAANGVAFGSDAKTPWKTYGTTPTDQNVIREISSDAHKQRLASYGHYCIDQIIEECKPDVYVGIEDVWAFKDFEKKPWWNNTKNIIWTTLDSIPILPDAFDMASKCDKFIVWASFAEEEMKKAGVQDVETIHGAINYSHFHPINQRSDIRNRYGINDNFVIGFVFKNQLRKSVPNLLEGFKKFKEKNPESKPKLLLHTDWAEVSHGWDIPRYIKEKNLDTTDILCTYICESCRNYFISPYIGEGKNCGVCGCEKSIKTKSNTFGVTESQLNEIYNCMDVYCHPFTSGGQEIPIQEAKAAGLITLVTEYSCGTDSCYEHQGGIPLKWSEYREPFTQFIKATTCPQDIADKIEFVYKMDNSTKQSLVNKAKEYVASEFSVENTISKLKEVILNSKKKHIQENQAEQKQAQSIEFGSLLDKEKKDRILIAVPESSEDVFLCTSLLSSMKEMYPEKDIYFATKSEHIDILDGNPYIYKSLEFSPQMENILLMEGCGSHTGYFEICFLPHIGTQKMFDYIHNGGSDKISFKIHSEKYNLY